MLKKQVNFLFIIYIKWYKNNFITSTRSISQFRLCILDLNIMFCMWFGIKFRSLKISSICWFYSLLRMCKQKHQQNVNKSLRSVKHVYIQCILMYVCHMWIGNIWCDFLCTITCWGVIITRLLTRCVCILFSLSFSHWIAEMESQSAKKKNNNIQIK